MHPFHPKGGATRDRHERGMECDGRRCAARRAARRRTAKACGPGALAAGAKPAEGDSADDGDTKAGLTGASTQEPVNTIAQGMSVFRLTCSDFAGVLLTFAHWAMGAA